MDSRQLEVAGHDGEVRLQQQSVSYIIVAVGGFTRGCWAYSTACIIMLGEGEVDDEVISKKLKSAVVVAGQDFVIVGAGNIDLTSHSDSEVNTMHLLHSGYIVLQQGTYDLKCSSSSEGHMGQCDSYNIEVMFHQCMEAVIIIAIQNDDQEEESEEENFDEQ